MNNVVMHATELQNLARLLSNNSFVSHWLHWNYPQRKPWLMAIECKDRSTLKSVEVRDLVDRGFYYNAEDGRHYIERDTSDMDLESLSIYYGASNE